jgi:hypothetical protein
MLDPLIVNALDVLQQVAVFTPAQAPKSTKIGQFRVFMGLAGARIFQSQIQSS